MDPCNRGELLTRSVQENAANRTAARRTRAQVCERPGMFIGLGACDNGGVNASNFLLDRLFHTFQNDASTHRIPKHCVGNASETPDPLSFGTAHASLRRFYCRAPALLAGATLVWNATP